MSTVIERREVYGTDRWKRLRRRVLDAHKWRCASCSRPGRLEVHHRKPIKAGGARMGPQESSTALWRLPSSATFKFNRNRGRMGSAYRAAL